MWLGPFMFVLSKNWRLPPVGVHSHSQDTSSLTGGHVPSLCLQQAHILILSLQKRGLRQGWPRVGTQLPHRVVGHRKGVRAEGPPTAPGSLQSSRKGAAWARRPDRTCLWLALPQCSLHRDAQGVYQLATLLMELDAEDEAPRLLVADALYRLGRLDEAHKALLVALSQRPQAAPVLARLALLQLRRGFFYDANQVRLLGHSRPRRNGAQLCREHQASWPLTLLPTPGL